MDCSLVTPIRNWNTLSNSFGMYESQWMRPICKLFARIPLMRICIRIDVDDITVYLLLQWSTFLHRVAIQVCMNSSMSGSRV